MIAESDYGLRLMARPCIAIMKASYTMRKKDYELIAGVFKDFLTKWAGETVDSFTVHSVLEALVQRLDTTEPRFDRQKFLTACGIETYVATPEQVKTFESLGRGDWLKD